jgi:hypothetical protein
LEALLMRKVVPGEAKLVHKVVPGEAKLVRKVVPGEAKLMHKMMSGAASMLTMECQSWKHVLRLKQVEHLVEHLARMPLKETASREIHTSVTNG